jgi:hypothetical protein
VNLSGMANQQSAMLGNLLGTPFNPTQGSPGSPARQSTNFDPQAYLAAYPDVVAEANRLGRNPAEYAAAHYQYYGANEGRTAGFATIPGVAATGPAPAAGDINRLYGVAGPQSTFADQPAAQYGYGSGGDITRSYGPQDNFSADRSRVEQAMFERLNPQLAIEEDRVNSVSPTRAYARVGWHIAMPTTSMGDRPTTHALA